MDYSSEAPIHKHSQSSILILYTVDYLCTTFAKNTSIDNVLKNEMMEAKKRRKKEKRIIT